MTAVILNLVLTLLLASHLLCVNLAMTGPLACAALRFRAARRDDTLADHVGRRLVKVCQISLLIAIGLGLFSSWLMWEFGQRQFFDALGRLPARRIYWGLAELAFYFLCMSLYGMLWDRLRGRPVLHASIAVVAATNLMYHFPPLFVIIGQLAAGAPGREAIDTSQLRQLMVEPAVLARLAHHLMASLTITAVAVMIGAQRMTDTRGAGEANSGVMRGSALVALTATLLQLAHRVDGPPAIEFPAARSVAGRSVARHRSVCRGPGRSGRAAALAVSDCPGAERVARRGHCGHAVGHRHRTDDGNPARNAPPEGVGRSRSTGPANGSIRARVQPARRCKQRTGAPCRNAVIERT